MKSTKREHTSDKEPKKITKEKQDGLERYVHLARESKPEKVKGYKFAF